MTNDIGFSALAWFKSSRSSANSQCAMCARLPGGGMAVRDSKHPDGPVLLFRTAEWRAFTEAVKHGELDLRPQDRSVTGEGRLQRARRRPLPLIKRPQRTRRECYPWDYVLIVPCRELVSSRRSSA
ncbi:MAG: DUF397 domain-containing protein [Streptosporangiaceae bacterium]|nr:DUF397 domain-containing protein [Streptosporangiaceae bacterium]